MKYSIRLKISILFGSVFVLIAVLFFICLKLELNLNYKEQNEDNEKIIKSLINAYNKDMNISQYFFEQDFELLDDEELARKIKKRSKNYLTIITHFGEFSSLFYNYTLYLRVVNQQEDLILQKKKDNAAFEVIFFGFLFSMCLVFILYLLVMKSLQPLEKLKKQITQTLNNGEDFSTQDYESDEIGEIATDFSDTIDKMRELAESRSLFLRTIMHEFKTPIGKGRIIAEMMQEEKYKERLVEIFKRLDSLIEESARIESLYSKNYQLCIRKYSFNEVLTEAKNLLLYDDFDEKVKIEGKGETMLEVDIDTFALVVKNLIENAVKYSDDGLCFIECFEDGFVVKNKGKKLKQPYTEYLNAFSRDKDSKNAGMGLGLYIVDRTCKNHNFKLSYEYIDFFHCFKITTNITPPPPHNKAKRSQKKQTRSQKAEQKEKKNKR